MSASTSPAATARVLQVVLSLDPGGTERLVLELVRRLNPEIPMAVCCLEQRGAWGEQLQQEGISVSALGRTPGFRPWLGRGIAAAAGRHGATMIHAHHYSPFVYSALARPWGGPPAIFTEHGRLSDAGPSTKRRWANRALGRAAARVFTVSRELGQHLIEEGFPPARVSTIYNGIAVGVRPDAARRQHMRSTLGIDDDRVVIGTIARLDPVKDLGTLIHATRALPADARALLLVVGDGSERPALERIAGETRASVRFLGHRDDARDLLAACDVYANSSISEGISLTILEAMAAGLPVVATRVGGTPEIVDASTGRLVPSRSIESLTLALADLASNLDLRRGLGTTARALVESVFTIERMVESYAQVYRGQG